MANNQGELPDIKYVHRLSIGNLNPNSPYTDEQGQKDLELLNRCLKKGRIIGKDRGFLMAQVGEAQLLLERTTYHIGFTRKPSFLE